MSGSSKSSQQIGQESVEALQRYLDVLKDKGQGLPAWDGKVSKSAVALAVGIDRQSLYKNKGCRALLEAAAEELGLQGISAREVGSNNDDAKAQRIQVLELQVSSLHAEVEGLRRKLRNFAHIEEHLIESGRRVIP